MLDAHAAVYLALTDTLPDNTLYETAYLKDRIEWGNNIYTGKIYVREGSALTLVPNKRTVMKPGLFVEKGSSLKVVRPPRP